MKIQTDIGKGGLAFIAILVAIGLAGCHSSGSGGTTNSAESTEVVQLQSFTVTGTSQSLPLIGGPVIDANENEGRFSVSWSTDRPNYAASLYVSKDSIPHGADDARFFRLTCSESSPACNTSATFGCRFTTSNEISCNNAPAVDLTNWFDQLPQNAFIILEVTTSVSGSGESVQVQFR